MSHPRNLPIPAGIFPNPSTPTKGYKGTPGRKPRLFDHDIQPLSPTPARGPAPSLSFGETAILPDDGEDVLGEAVDPEWASHLPTVSQGADTSPPAHHSASSPLRFPHSETPSELAARIARQSSLTMTFASSISMTAEATAQHYTEIAGLTSHKRALNATASLKHLKESDQYRRDEIDVDKLPQFFDSLAHDYKVRDQGAISQLVRVEWIDAPGKTHGFDIRGRTMRIIPIPTAQHIKPDRVVFRSRLVCNGACQVVLPAFSYPGETGTEQFEQYIHSQLQSSERSQISPSPSISAASALATRASSCPAEMLIEMTWGQTQHQVLWVWHVRPKLHRVPQNTDLIRVSSHLRNLLHQTAGQFGMTASRLQLWMNKLAEQRESYAWWVKQHCPLRFPHEAHFLSAIALVNAQTRLDNDPLAAIEILSRKHPNEILLFRHTGVLSPSDMPNERKKPLICIVGPPSGLEAGILYASTNGLGMDSSWRNKNAHRAPMTVLSTLDHRQRMVPVAVMVSQHANQQVYTEFLRVVSEAIRKHAISLSAGTAIPCLANELHQRILACARNITDDPACGFTPSSIMIDGDDAERLAIDAIWPSVPKRVCQFHLMQACKSRLREIFGNKGDWKHKVTETLKAIRTCQRCPSHSEWLQYASDFRRRVSITICREQDDPTVMEVWTYLSKTWFSPLWRPYSVDYALPRDFLRDGHLNTNNYTEATFRIFDRVMLAGRANKRMDRLLLVIIQVYFPYFQNLPARTSRPDPIFVQHLFLGLNIWQANAIQEVAASHNSLPPALRSRMSKVYIIRRPSENSAPKDDIICGLWGQSGRWHCICQHFNQTGKRCMHIWAATAFAMAGSVVNMDEDCANISAQLQKEERESRRLAAQRMTSPSIGEAQADNTIWEDDFEYWGVDILDPANVGVDALDLDTQADDTPLDHGFRSPIGRRHTSQHNRPQPIEIPAPTVSESVPSPSISPVPCPTSPIGQIHPDPVAFALAVPPAATIPAPVEAPLPPAATIPAPVKAPLPRGSARLAGRPPKLTPLQPSRRKGQASTVTKSLKVKKSDKVAPAPVGIKNSGNDCYAIALFQVLFHSPAFRQHYKEKEKDIHSDIAKLMSTVFGNLEKGFIRKYDNMSRDLCSLFDVGLPGLQQDPTEMFSRLMSLFDKGDTRFSDILSVGVGRRFVCGRRCQSWFRDGEAARSPFTLIYPGSLDISDQSAEVQLVRLYWDSLADDKLVETSCPICETEVADAGAADIDLPEGLMVICPVWPTSDSNAIDSSPFAIPHTFKLGTPTEPFFTCEHESTYQWTLRGFICRTNMEVDRGHYVAIVTAGEKWWLLDDGRVHTCAGPVDAFEGGRTPVLLLYDKKSEDAIKPGEQDRSYTPADRDSAMTKPPSPLVTNVDDPAWWTRYTQVEWQKPIAWVKPIITCRIDSNQSSPNVIPQTVFEAIRPLLHEFSRIDTEVLAEREAVRFLDHDQWYGEDNITVLCKYVERTTFRRDNSVYGDQKDIGDVDRERGLRRLRFIPSILRWSMSKTPVFEDDHGVPWPYFPGGAFSDEWRNERMITWMSTGYGQHFIAVLICGPEKLIVPFDSLAGECGDSAVLEAWPTIIQRRLDWERENREEIQAFARSQARNPGDFNDSLPDADWYDERDRGWLVAPNNMDTLSRLDWVKQEDQSSCGPLTTAAIMLAIQGLRPSKYMLGVTGEWDEANRICLRNRLLGVYISSLKARGRSTHLEALESYGASLKPWTRSAIHVEKDT